MPRWLSVSLFVVALGCSSTPDDETPEGALRLFLTAMDRSDWDADARRTAYELLSEQPRERLLERARMAESLSGRDLEPWEMIPQGRFRLRFSPRRGDGMVAEVNGDAAVVVVTGAREGERAEVQMVREEEGWRVVLEIPPLREEETE